MIYKDYIGAVRFDEEARLFHGVVVNVKAVLTFEGKTVDELEIAFRESIDDYLDWCAERGKEPAKPFSGKFQLRVGPRLHSKISAAAIEEGVSINEWINRLLERALDNQPKRASKKNVDMNNHAHTHS